MSVINQVLHQLEQRGANPIPDQVLVRAVPPARRRSRVGPMLFLLALTALGAGAWLYARKPAVVAPRPEPPAVAAGQLTVPERELLLPASRLSFELSSVPLPSSAREAKKASSSPGGAASQPARLPPAAPGEPVALAVSGELPLKQVSPAQRADAEFRRGVALMQQGRTPEAMASYEMALKLDAGLQAARQALVALLLEGKRSAEAERVLQDGLKLRPEQTGFAMLLARLQVERGAAEQAMATLEKSLPHADEQADYQAFVAALLQRQNRHKEAVNHYQIALQLAPDNGVWLMGYGISLQALQRNEDAKEAFRRALDTQTLGPDLQKFVQQKLKAL